MGHEREHELNPASHPNLIMSQTPKEETPLLLDTFVDRLSKSELTVLSNRCRELTEGERPATLPEEEEGHFRVSKYWHGYEPILVEYELSGSKSDRECSITWGQTPSRDGQGQWLVLTCEYTAYFDGKIERTFLREYDTGGLVHPEIRDLISEERLKVSWQDHVANKREIQPLKHAFAEQTAIQADDDVGRVSGDSWRAVQDMLKQLTPADRVK